MRPRLPSGPGDAGGLGWRRRRERRTASRCGAELEQTGPATALDVGTREGEDGSLSGACGVGRPEASGRHAQPLSAVGSAGPLLPIRSGTRAGPWPWAHVGNGSRRCRFPLFPSPGETGFLLEIELGWPVLSGPRVAHFPGFQT